MDWATVWAIFSPTHLVTLQRQIFEIINLGSDVN
jgi:hypothetical protein